MNKMKIKWKDVPRFLKYLFENREDLYEQFKVQDRTDLVGATVALLNREENHVSAFSPNTFLNTKKVPDERLNPYRYAGSIDTKKIVEENSSVLPIFVAAAVASAVSDSASAATPSDTFSAGGGDFSGGGADGSF